MKKINIYITETFRGRLESGEGKYCIYLELVRSDGRTSPDTRNHTGGFFGTTRNRLALLACIEALTHVIESCIITIYIDSHYMAGNEGNLARWEASGWMGSQRAVRNRDLWSRYHELARNHLVTIKAEKKHPYQGVSYMELKKEITMREDRRGEEENG